ncbi:MAG: hypothetical protein U0931_05750 [Vulcanimicrobiota bacterium]
MSPCEPFFIDFVPKLAPKSGVEPTLPFSLFTVEWSPLGVAALVFGLAAGLAEEAFCVFWVLWVLEDGPALWLPPLLILDIGNPFAPDLSSEWHESPLNETLENEQMIAFVARMLPAHFRHF